MEYIGQTNSMMWTQNLREFVLLMLGLPSSLFCTVSVTLEPVPLILDFCLLTWIRDAYELYFNTSHLHCQWSYVVCIFVACWTLPFCSRLPLFVSLTCPFLSIQKGEIRETTEIQENKSRMWNSQEEIMDCCMLLSLNTELSFLCESSPYFSQGQRRPQSVGQAGFCMSNWGLKREFSTDFLNISYTAPK